MQFCKKVPVDRNLDHQLPVGWFLWTGTLPIKFLWTGTLYFTVFSDFPPVHRNLDHEVPVGWFLLTGS